MAAPLCRLIRSVSTKRELSHSRIFVLVSSKRCFVSGSSNQQRQEKGQPEEGKSHFLTCALVVASGLGYGFYKWHKNELTSSLDISREILPTIHALKHFHVGDVSNNRERYNFIADVVEISAPSVVYIEIKDQRKIDFFTGKPATTSNGSGFIVKEDGLILTNAHVVINRPNTLVKVNVSPRDSLLPSVSYYSYSLEVRLQDGTTYTGVVEDVDMQSDLATVRIDKTKLPVMKLGSSSNIRPGEFVVAIGSPLSLSNTITSGVVSSVNRASEELGLHNKNMGYIQTDAAITFGNSGGPLVNLSGEAIGINAMKVTAGISFAIPIDYAKEFLNRSELRRKNKGMESPFEPTRRRYMGITMLTLTPDILFELQQRNDNVPSTVRHGVLVWKVMIGSPAYLGGLKAGDIVIHVNDEPVISASSIYKVLEKSGSLNLTVLRNGHSLRIKIEPEDV